MPLPYSPHYPTFRLVEKNAVPMFAPDYYI
jgi:hypothetical protein